MISPLLDAQALADRLGISRDYAYRLMARGEIRVTRVGRKVRVTEESLTDYIAANTASGRKAKKGAAA